MQKALRSRLAAKWNNRDFPREVSDRCQRARKIFTGNQQRLREIDPNLKKVAIFAHFSGVKLDPGEKRGDTVIVRLENKCVLGLSP